ncbi:hypothetical protein H6781_01725 [Candidatus Nomurabacteria bacterium]|nr:hypothetical protein [Candidatus Nomurabacteria bacterium]
MARKFIHETRNIKPKTIAKLIPTNIEMFARKVGIDSRWSIVVEIIAIGITLRKRLAPATERHLTNQ